MYFIDVYNIIIWNNGIGGYICYFMKNKKNNKIIGIINLCIVFLYICSVDCWYILLIICDG